ncbi:hypothetical protein PFISCL1PPCAC_13672, partial [Pristionchus fissidentatus]
SDMSVTLHNVTDTLTPDHEQYDDALNAAAAAFLEAEALFDDGSFTAKEGWKKKGDDASIAIYVKSTPQGKLVAVSAILECPVDDVMHETWTGLDSLPTWNTSINFAETVAVLSDNADIVRYGNNDVLIVTGREFLTARIYRKTVEGYIMASRSVDLPEKPENKNKVRAFMHLGASRFRADPSNARRTLCDVVMLGDLRGSLPKTLVDSVMPTIMSMATEQNVKHFKELGQST